MDEQVIHNFLFFCPWILRPFLPNYWLDFTRKVSGPYSVEIRVTYGHRGYLLIFSFMQFFCLAFLFFTFSQHFLFSLWSLVQRLSFYYTPTYIFLNVVSFNPKNKASEREEKLQQKEAAEYNVIPTLLYSVCQSSCVVGKGKQCSLGQG